MLYDFRYYLLLFHSNSLEARQEAILRVKCAVHVVCATQVPVEDTLVFQVSDLQLAVVFLDVVEDTPVLEVVLVLAGH